MLKVGQTEKVEITGYSSEGMGVCRMDGCAVFVPNAIRGELCVVRVTHVSRNSAHGKIEEIVQRSPHRISRACPQAKLCGGCQLHHMDYEEELRFKAQKVYDALTRLGGQSLPLGGKVPPQGADEGTSDDRALSITGAAGTCPAGGGASTPRTAEPAGETGHPGAGSCDTIQNVHAAAEPKGFALPITGAAEIGGYRNKAQYPVAMKNGRPAAGFYKNRTHELVPVRRCAILPEVFDRVRDVVMRWAEEDRVSVYDEATGQGLLRHIYLRRGAVSGELMVCLVVNGDSLPRENRLLHALEREIPGLASVVLSVNRKNTNVVLGDELRTLWGRDWIEDELCGFRFRLSPRSFYQVNHDQAQRLYEKAVELAGLHGTETVLDLYCGTGTITLALSRYAGRAVGVEVVPEAIEDAKQNAARNGVANVEFFCADAMDAAARLCASAAGNRQQATGNRNSLPPGGKVSAAEALTDEGMSDDLPARIDVIVVDPPRKGLAPEVIDAMVRMAPVRIVYVSCDPATLARDVKLLTGRGYALQTAEAFDLFPRTCHVETVCLLSKLHSGQHAEIDLELSELDLTAAESAATYEEIKGYVQEHFGFQVSSLQIAQTKRSLEIPMGRNYNPSKKEIHHIPQCPQEKAEAIRAALEHFQMIN